MFFVFGENDNHAKAVGLANTLSQAIMNWSSRGSVTTEQEAVEEFNRWNPTVVEGSIVKAEIETEVKFSYKVQR